MTIGSQSKYKKAPTADQSSLVGSMIIGQMQPGKQLVLKTKNPLKELHEATTTPVLSLVRTAMKDIKSDQKNRKNRT